MNLTYRLAEAADYPELIALWRESVIATHHFLAETDRAVIEKKLPEFFSQVQLKIWSAIEVIGFSGTHGDSLEMLFLAPEYFGQGLGSQILQQLIQQDGIRLVDVNQDNVTALKFYEKNGFQLTGRSEKDGLGMPYPLLHLTHA